MENFYLNEFFKKQYSQATQKFAFKKGSIEECKKWKDECKKVFIDDLGGFFPQPKNKNIEVIEERAYETYNLKRVIYYVTDDLPCPAYILTPKNAGEKNPAVVAIHGHGYGSRDICGLLPDGSDKDINKPEQIGYQKNFAISLVNLGFIVIAPELAGFGDMKFEEDKDNYSSCHRVSTWLTMLGKTTSGLRVMQTIRAVDCLQTLPNVDPDRIGAMGISGGGLVCAFTSAIDERIKTAVVSGYTNTYKDSVLNVLHCVDNYYPNAINHAEMPDIIGLIAPRALFIESGEIDDIFPVYATKYAYDYLKEIYKCFNAEDNIDMEIFKGDHQIWGNESLKFLKNKL
ncbi:MAG: dienelactone hydrolase [Clostridia bacterium]|nr:dienelactone hydrolase [Clostridia bacterium]